MVSMKGATVSDIMEIQSISPGFRFCPTDVELVSHYLKRKNQSMDLSPHMLAEVKITKCEPWDLPDQSILKSDHEWFFFVPVDRKYPNGSQAKRATNIGFWKATGKEREIRSRKNVIGTKRTLVFHIGRAPNGKRTNWIMNEYCLRENRDQKTKNSYVLCRVRRKEGSGNNSDSNDNLYPGEANKASSSKVHSHGERDDNNGVKDGKSFDDMQEDDDDSDTLKEDIVNESKEDDCFEEILKDDIVELDNPFYKPIMSKAIQPVQSSKHVDGPLYEATACRASEPVQSLTQRTRPVHPFMQRRHKFQGAENHNIQGTANRRIRLEKKSTPTRLLTKRSSGDSNIKERWLVQVISSPLLCIVCVITVVLLLLFAFVF